MKILLIIVVGLVLAGGFSTSCKHYGTEPTDTSKCDTCHKPCDTCNLNHDSLSHAFEWTEYTIDGETSLTGCWIFGDTDIRIVGNYLYKFNGVNFTKLSAYNVTRNMNMGGGWNGYNLFGFDSNDYWLASGSIVYHSVYGTHFEEFRPGNANACWGASSNDMFVVGNSGQIHHYDGTKYTDMVSGTMKNLNSVWGTSHNDVWAAGFNPTTAQSILLHFNGDNWKEETLSNIGDIRPFSHALEEVWAVDSNQHHLVVAGGSLLWRGTDDVSWRSDSGFIKNRLSDGSFIGLFHIRGNTSNDFVATGDGGFISHWNGKTWMRYDDLYNPNNTFYITNAVSMKDNTICVVGAKDGQSWVAVGRRKQ